MMRSDGAPATSIRIFVPMRRGVWIDTPRTPAIYDLVEGWVDQPNLIQNQFETSMQSRSRLPPLAQPARIGTPRFKPIPIAFTAPQAARVAPSG